jgi:hypothetical protein
MSRLPVKGPLVINNGIMVKLHWTFAARNISNVLIGTLTATPPDFDALANTLFTSIKGLSSTTGWLAECHPSLLLTAVSVKDLRTAHQADHVSSGPSVAGTGTGQPMALNSSMVITERTAMSGPGFRGRVYLAGMISQPTFDGIHLTQAVSDAGVAFVLGVKNVMATNSIPMGVGQRSLAADPLAPPGSANASPRASSVIPVTAVLQENLRVDSQRRRTGR